MNKAHRDFRIMLVEDNVDHALLFADILVDGGAKVEHCEDGAVALSRLRAAVDAPEAPIPDLVLLDLDMPEVDGFQTLAFLKADVKLRRIPVVVLTTSKARQDVARALDGHANSYVCKTSDFDIMERLLEEIRDYWSSANLRFQPVLDRALFA